MAYKSGNPALGANTFTNFAETGDKSVMTMDGVVAKSALLLAVLLAGGVAGWRIAVNNPEIAGTLILTGVVVGFIVALITIFKKTVAKYSAPVYALVEGFVIGAISMIFEAIYPGVVVQAILITLGIFLMMLVLYRSEVIKVTEKFKLGIVAATGGIALYYIAYLIAGFFGVSLPLVDEASGWGIAFSVIVVIVASLNLVLDFDFINQGVKNKAPKYLEWYASFGLMVTLIWLYLEILRLLGKARR